MRISYISYPIHFFIIFTACLLCVSSNSGIPANNHSSILSLKLDKLPKDDEVLKLFQQWKKEMGRVYNDLDEMAKRFEIFVSTLKHIVETNAKRDSAHSTVLGLTKFADWSSVEFKETYLSMNTEKNKETYLSMITQRNDNDDDVVVGLARSTNTTSYQSVDWRSLGAVTPVKDQGTCDCSWAFAAVGAIEGIVAIKAKLQELSVQELLDCVPEPNGCSGGSSDEGFRWVNGNNGVALWSDYPYKAEKGDCKASQFPSSQVSAIGGFVQAGRSEIELQEDVSSHPVKVGFYVTDDFRHYTNGIYEGPDCPVDSAEINFNMLAVGYDSVDGEDYWIVKNSLGTAWGIEGYSYVKRNIGKKYGVCSINAWGSYPILKNN
jgi:C1A family cysteine protease